MLGGMRMRKKGGKMVVKVGVLYYKQMANLHRLLRKF
jgi:hypothetical protein